MRIFVVSLIVLFGCYCQVTQAHDNPGRGRGHHDHGGGHGYGHDDSQQSESGESPSDSRESVSGSSSSGSRSSGSSSSGSSSSGSSSSEEEPPCGAGRPHIVVLMAENFGWNDFGENGATPYLLSLAAEGIQFDTSYVLPLSSPTRSALLSGLYPHHTGMQHLDLYPRQPYGLPTQFTLLPEKLKDLCYSTHAVGRWQLGFCAEEYLPNNRGFDSFYGTYSEAYSLSDKQSFDPFTGNSAYDLHEDYDFVKEDEEHLSFKLLNRALRIIKKHKKPSKNPLFLYNTFEIKGNPQEVPSEYWDQFEDVVNPNRRAFLAMSALMDDGVRKIVKALRKKKMLDNTLILFISANGGDASLGGNNFPLRGNKGTCYDGGMRVPTFVWGNMLNTAGYTQSGLIHAVDWFPTLLSIAGGVNDASIDGVDQSAMVLNGSASARTSAFLTLDDIVDSKAVLRDGAFKLIDGEPSYLYPIHIDSETNGHYDIPTGLFSPVFNYYEIFLPGQGQQPSAPPSLPQTLLYNVASDPEETTEVSATNPVNVLIMQYKVNMERATGVGSFFVQDASDLPPEGDPANFDGKWSTGWCQAESSPPPAPVMALYG